MDIPLADFSHPQHELKQREYHLPHSCDLCCDKITGSGYSCHWRLCAFNLHEECARYPETLRSFFAHPWHDLTLACTSTDDVRSTCDLCREDAPGGVFLYRCAPCGFTVHPRCTRLPPTTRSELHPEHGLTALPRVGTCAACSDPCGVWVYRCGLCDIDLHVECLHGARSSSGGKNENVEDLHTHGGAGSSGEKKGTAPSLGHQAMDVLNNYCGPCGRYAGCCGYVRRELVRF